MRPRGKQQKSRPTCNQGHWAVSVTAGDGVKRPGGLQVEKMSSNKNVERIKAFMISKWFVALQR